MAAKNLLVQLLLLLCVTLLPRQRMKSLCEYNYTDQWKGQSDDGKELPDGTYYYVITLNSAKVPTGWVYVNR